MSENRWLFPNRQRVTGRTVRLAALAALIVAGACSDGQTMSEPPAIMPAFTEGAPSVDLRAQGAQAIINGGRLESFNPATSTGTGVYESFVRLSTNAVTEQGYNTSGRPVQFDENTSPTFTRDLPLNNVPQQPCGFGPPGSLCREFNADINQIAGLPSGLIDLLRVRLFVSPTPGIKSADPNSPTFGQADGTTLVWDLDGAGNVEVRFDYNNSTGSGGGDVRLLVPVANFPPAAEAACPYDAGTGGPCGFYIYLYSQWGTTNGAAEGNGETNDGFEEWNTRKAAFVQVTKTAEPTLTRTHKWDIEKSVDQDEITLFPGESGTVNYDVQVIYDGFVDSDWAVSGDITIHNPSAEAANIESVTDVISGGPEGDINVAVNCGVTFPFSLPAGGDLVCTYSHEFDSGEDRTNTARVQLVDAGVNTGTVDIDFDAAEVTEIDETATITDTVEGELGGATAPGEPLFEYSREFTCDEDEGEHPNIATITGDDTGTMSSDDANVTVNCEAITVEKTAETSFTRTWTWEINKAIDITGEACGGDGNITGQWDATTNTATVLENEILDICYTITVDASFEDSDFEVAGTITISNANPSSDAELSDVSDLVSPDIDADVNCPSLTVPAGGNLVCTYSASLPDGSSRTNTATATLFGVDYTGTADVEFGDPSEEIDECVNVEDLLEGDLDAVDLGMVCADDPLPHTFGNLRTFTGEDVECGDNSFNNTATATANDTGAEVSDDETVNIFVECEEGCTLTQGYWKTHNASFAGGASKKADPTWALIGDADGDGVEEAEQEDFFLSGDTWFGVFWTAAAGNAYYNLAQQYMAAVLNVLAGATPPADVADAIDDATTFFENTTPAQAAALKGKAAKDLRDLAGILGEFNEGLIGPGHCTENGEPI